MRTGDGFCFVYLCYQRLRSLIMGDAECPETCVGLVIDAAAQARIQEAIAMGKSVATLALEIETPETGYFVWPRKNIFNQEQNLNML